jgi:hypothetical protein
MVGQNEMNKMKSLTFNVPGIFDKILSGEKTLTLRCIYIPRYLEGEEILLKERLGDWKDKRFGRMLRVEVIKVFPLKLIDITSDIAKKEGFNNVKESLNFLMSQGLKSLENWCFAIEWRLLKNKGLRDLK